MLPVAGVSLPARSCSSVDLPAPLGPISDTLAPSATMKVTFSNRVGRWEWRYEIPLAMILIINDRMATARGPVKPECLSGRGIGSGEPAYRTFVFIGVSLNSGAKIGKKIRRTNPSYEIMMDDLRDYRFYAADMKHPSEVAVDYIYDIFAESFFDKATRDLAVKASRLSARMAHRNICAASEATASFQAKTLEMARRLSEEYPEVSQQIMKHIQLP